MACVPINAHDNKQSVAQLKETYNNESGVVKMITRVHVNQHVIKANAKHGKNDPVFTVKRGKTNTYAHTVKITGVCDLVYRPDKPLSCGAKVWIETKEEVQCG